MSIFIADHYITPVVNPYHYNLRPAINQQESLAQQKRFYNVTLADSLQESPSQPGLSAIFLHQYVFFVFNLLSLLPSHSLSYTISTPFQFYNKRA